MFGESESESPRVGSPWDSLLSSGTSTPSSQSGPSDFDLPKVYKLSLPKLVPEAEEGNVEYKLQLIEPSPERFLRLVTQLKWRLLEGGGQAYYELGVADSGQLVGLTRQNLERSLETLEAMAGEIGASVVVVKEIQVPPSMFEPANRNVMLPKTKGLSNGNGGSHTHRAKGTERNGKPYRSRPSDWGAVEIIRNTASQYLKDDSETSGLSDCDRSKEEVCLTIRVSPRPSIQDLAPSPVSVTDDDCFPFDTELQFFSTQPSSEYLSPSRKGANVHKESAMTSMQPNGKVLGLFHDFPYPEIPKIVEAENSPRPKAQQVQNDFDTLLVPLATVSSAPAKQPVLKGGGSHLAAPTCIDAAPEPRLIVEALVVRKLSADEVFLDFGGFSLAD